LQATTLSKETVRTTIFMEDWSEVSCPVGDEVDGFIAELQCYQLVLSPTYTERGAPGVS
jgi:hypothetical protein